MPELRRDPITHRWAIIATERAKRPTSYRFGSQEPTEGLANPFAPGNEHMTPPEIVAVRPAGGYPNDSSWTVRVVPNKYPALRVEGGLDRRPMGIYDMMNGIGAHEVIIESPDEHAKFHSLPREHMIDVLRVYRDRMKDLKRDCRMKFSLLFRNYGSASGATITHAHSQLIALPVVPFEVRELCNGAKRYFDFRERNVFEDMIRFERAEDRRVVFENNDFILIAPFASRVPFELSIIPRFQETHFEETSDGHFNNLAEVLSFALGSLDQNLGDPAYNMIFQSAPYDSGEMPWYRWHIQILPKLVNVAGFELGTGFFINPIAPEEAARVLRKRN